MAETILTFDVAEFRTMFPAFADDTAFPDATLQMYWDQATCYISDVGNYGRLQGTCRQLVLNYMTAHIAQISVIIASGDTPNLATSASVGDVSVSMNPPPLTSQFGWWLSTTPYGQQALALLKVRSTGGWYTSASPELASFRKRGGTF